MGYAVYGNVVHNITRWLFLLTSYRYLFQTHPSSAARVKGVYRYATVGVLAWQTKGNIVDFLLIITPPKQNGQELQYCALSRSIFTLKPRVLFWNSSPGYIAIFQTITRLWIRQAEWNLSRYCFLSWNASRLWFVVDKWSSSTRLTSTTYLILYLQLHSKEVRPRLSFALELTVPCSFMQFQIQSAR